MKRFDEVIPGLLTACRSRADLRWVRRWCIARDLRGRLRIALEWHVASNDAFPPPANFAPGQPKLAQVEEFIRMTLGAYFVGPVLELRGSAESARLAGLLFQEATDWDPDAEYPPGPGETTPGSWKKLEARLSKHSWLHESSASQAAEEIWPLGTGATVVTFYSFKGGVGRTTALLSSAWQLARGAGEERPPKKVVILDLDLESPGIGNLLLGREERGILDFIIDHVATGSTECADLQHPANTLGADASQVTVFPAGQLTLSYLEKLARLDLLSGQESAQDEPSSTEKALRTLLKKINGTLNPDFILIDSRAGLHDLAGLSLYRLAHIDVLVSRTSAEGLELIIEQLIRSKHPDQLRVILAQTMLYPDKSNPVHIGEIERFLDRSYPSFQKHVYGQTEEAEVPDRDSRIGAHYPLPIRYKDVLRNFMEIEGVREALFEEDFRELCSRIVELSSPEEESQ